LLCAPDAAARGRVDRGGHRLPQPARRARCAGAWRPRLGRLGDQLVAGADHRAPGGDLPRPRPRPVRPHRRPPAGPSPADADAQLFRARPAAQGVPRQHAV
ncbi:hypothetical protein IWQ56_004510, partial [Coemansia nantahalensis]